MEPTTSDTTALRAYAEQLQRQFETMVTEAPAVMARAKAVQVTEKSRDGLVTVTVGPRGDLVRLDLDPRIYRRPDSRELADTITATVQKAVSAAREAVVETFSAIVPPEQMRATLDGDLDTIIGDLDRRTRGA
ncbi:YbaB/EbfC family nucleoid-associated protein [Klenkia brasiliensis]|uniref:Conserved DNA-binding protein YbaB n=1 Tax=Klenkia brasiliensis TaxID=333142 RepID=A0A1G7QHN6_9ACTN|nr:YbaB/EbfC family nucleoid-associated protein [Klenkia brasiliensis]SDF98033.1 Conserved DNA-binding protein YbaB [Klenkia brasiliensis]